MSDIKRTPARTKAEELAKLLRPENPDYDYLREVFRALRKELNVAVVYKEKATPIIPIIEHYECKNNTQLKYTKNVI